VSISAPMSNASETIELNSCMCLNVNEIGNETNNINDTNEAKRASCQYSVDA